MSYVSLIIPVQNKLIATQRTLRSIEFQTANKNSFEVILITDRSSNRVVRALRKIRTNYKLRVIEVNSIKSGSAVRARNIGWRQAISNILIFLDCDMIAHPNLIETHRNYYLTENNIGKKFVVLGYRFLIPKNTVYLDWNNRYTFKRWFSGLSVLPDEREPFLLRQSIITSHQKANWGCLYSHNFSIHKNLLNQVGSFDDSFDGCGGEDVELGYRLFKLRTKFIINRNAIGFHQYHSRSIKRWKDNFSNINRIVSKHPELIDFRRKVLKEWRKIVSFK